MADVPPGFDPAKDLPPGYASGEEYYGNATNDARWTSPPGPGREPYRMCALCFHVDRDDGTGGTGKPRRSCAAYPEQIPALIWMGDHDHRFPWPGDDGVVFEQDPERAEFDPGRIGENARGLDEDGN